MIGDAFDTGEAGEEVETLGGYLVTQVGRLPVRGEIISGPGEFEIEVLDADPRRVKRLRIGARKERPHRVQRSSAPRCGSGENRRYISEAAIAERRTFRLSDRSASKLRASSRWRSSWRGAGSARHRASCRRAVIAGDGAVQRLADLFVTIPVMVWLIDGAGAGRLDGIPAAAIAGWWFGFGYFVTGPVLGRIRVSGRRLDLRLAVAVRGLGLPAYLALFTAFGFALARRSGRAAHRASSRWPSR